MGLLHVVLLLQRMYSIFMFTVSVSLTNCAAFVRYGVDGKGAEHCGQRERGVERVRDILAGFRSFCRCLFGLLCCGWMRSTLLLLCSYPRSSLSSGALVYRWNIGKNCRIFLENFRKFFKIFLASQAEPGGVVLLPCICREGGQKPLAYC